MLIVSIEVCSVFLQENLEIISKELKLGVCPDIAMLLLGIYSKEMIVSMHTNNTQVFSHFQVFAFAYVNTFSSICIVYESYL